MRPIQKPKTRAERRRRRHLRVRKKVAGTAERPRLVVYRSLKHIYAQLVDDDAQRTLMTRRRRLRAVEPGEGKAEQGARRWGSARRARPRRRGSRKVVFDRAGYKYHGRVKAVADGAREGGLEFYGRSSRWERGPASGGAWPGRTRRRRRPGGRGGGGVAADRGGGVAVAARRRPAVATRRRRGDGGDAASASGAISSRT